MHYGKINKTDVANGLGVRVSLFVSGCRNHCKECFNPQTWDFNYGNEYDDHARDEILTALYPYHISGLSILGGEPLEPENIDDITKLCETVRFVYPGKSIWLYTGYLFEDVKHLPIFKYIDVVVDGPYADYLKDPGLAFRGSINQRLIDVKKTLASGHIVEVKL